MSNKRPYCLTIAGFDPSGGAGILADIKAFEQFKVQGLAVQTANTIQTEDSFTEINWISEETILLQLKTLLERYTINHFKIGLIESTELLQKVTEIIFEKNENSTVIWDPILSATSGGEFDVKRFDSFLNSTVFNKLIITPNLPEYESLNLKGKKNIIYLKAGHSKKVGYDKLFWKGNEYPLKPQIKTKLKKHGTGCVFSAALLANLAQNYSIIKSCLRAKRYVEKRIVSNTSLLAYHK